MKTILEKRTALNASTEFSVRFSEVDSMGIVWHGNYALYFEDAREAFGKKYHIGYHDILKSGYGAPVVEMQISYKRAMPYGTMARAIAFFVNTVAAKVIFEYEIRSMDDNILLASGRSVQVFIDDKGQLVLFNPDFYKVWKKKNGIQ
ncbi:MAG: acyl-CoA thioesterase [Bacteroides sp.]|nr:acyl-CoA thioesterase [Bacteroides sp.]MCM1084879.1 acyl-CoA thioesterase [Bacteroides sp.]